MSKLYCLECGFVGPEDKFSQVNSPYSGERYICCPQCSARNKGTAACDEPGCARQGTNRAGHRLTCWGHSEAGRRNVESYGG